MEKSVSQAATDLFAGDHLDSSGTDIVNAALDFIRPQFVHFGVWGALIKTFDQSVDEQTSLPAGKTEGLLQKF
jgi:hypothetical protein